MTLPIKTITLEFLTARFYCTELEKQASFYTEVLGLPLLARTDHFFTLRTGRTLLTFERSDQPHYYHFAFNIPSFQSREALDWLRERVTVLQDGETELIDFVNWNAEALYFYDAAGNIVEFIARKNLKLISARPFTAASITGLSEIGMPVAAVGRTFEWLHQKTGIGQYWGELENFCAAGDEQSLFIIVNETTKYWYPTDKPARSAPFLAAFRQGDKLFRLDFHDGEAQLLPLK